MAGMEDDPIREIDAVIQAPPKDVSNVEDKDAQDPDLAPNRVFEITSDLNIAQINEQADESILAKGVIEKIPPKISETPTPQPSTPSHQDPAPSSAAFSAKYSGPSSTEPIGSAPNATAKAAKTLPPAPSQAVHGDSPKIAPTIPNPVPNDSHVKAIRTYESDIAEAMAQRKTSVASMAIAESEKRQRDQAQDRQLQGESGQNRQSPRSPLETVPVQRSSTKIQTGTLVKKIFLTLISLIFIAVGGGLGYFLYSQSPVARPTLPSYTIDTNKTRIIPVDSTVYVPIDGLGMAAIISKVKAEAAKSQADGTIRDIILVKDVSGNQTKVGIKEMVEIMSLPVPDTIRRSLSTDWMLGSYSSFGKNYIFIIATNNFFQNAFSGMLTWESYMLDDLAPYLYTDDLILRGRFQDRIIGNRDVREYVNVEERTIFMYSFVDENTMVFAGTETVLSEILSRLESQAYMR